MELSFIEIVQVMQLEPTRRNYVVQLCIDSVYFVQKVLVTRFELHDQSAFHQKFDQFDFCSFYNHVSRCVYFEVERILDFSC